ncbi:hypothetical protein [Halococcus thailandensis]|uniref:Uncharacterized protein n=1 Tax=Halococcus thailandensis JCM 13552 TaxID=1227457 RepID=M0NG22_9EURY|nr:hypothetical protein [Halococcus thailandensis]EMA56024.1 hypothetical protein C451_04461 [Halococcus thailandensis JCM 13552]
MTETGDTESDGSDNDELGGVLGEVGLDYADDDEADQVDNDPENNEIDSTDEIDTSDPSNPSDSESPTDGASNDTATEADDGPFAPDPEMQLTKSLGTKLTPPEKEFIDLYVEFSDEYEHTGEFLRVFVDELRQEYGEEVMRRKEALEELKGGL